MVDKARVGSTIGRSGAQCTDIITNPSSEAEKPYLTGVKGPSYDKPGRGGGAGHSGERLRSHGFGPSKQHINEEVPELTAEQRKIVLLVSKKEPLSPDDIKEALRPHLDKVILGTKGSLELIVKGSQGYQLTAEGRRVVGLI